VNPHRLAPLASTAIAATKEEKGLSMLSRYTGSTGVRVEEWPDAFGGFSGPASRG
jgi:hypothetical protein